DLNLLRVKSGRDDGSGIVGASASNGGRSALGIGPDEALRYGYRSIRDNIIESCLQFRIGMSKVYGGTREVTVCFHRGPDINPYRTHPGGAQSSSHDQRREDLAARDDGIGEAR